MTRFIRNLFLCAVFIFSNNALKAQQKVFTKNGIISFYSKTTIETIQAINKKALAVIDLEKNIIEFAVLMKGFEFEKALMQEHFNENYVESDLYPKATFKGKFEDVSVPLSLADNNKYSLKLTGILTMHAVSKSINAIASITVKNKMISASTNFNINLNDFNIKVPALVSNNINKQIAITVNLTSLQEMK
jgi:polyisoprenoid-binding protein YceI